MYTNSAVGVILIILFLYHGLQKMVDNDINVCGSLLEKGSLQGNTWQPSGCMMHYYSYIDVEECFKYRHFQTNNPVHIAFVGDSRIRQMYMDMAWWLSEGSLPPPEKHADMAYKHPGSKATISFHWHPFVDSSMYGIYKKWLSSPIKERPDTVVTGSATWSIKQSNGSNEALMDYKTNLLSLLPFLREIASTTDVLWNIQDPVNESQLHPVRAMITNHRVNAYNKVAESELHGESVIMWLSARLIAAQTWSSHSDGLHVGNETLALKTQVLLNYYCNQPMDPADASCCIAPRIMSALQAIVISFLTVLMLICLIFYIHSKYSTTESNEADTTESQSSEVILYKQIGIFISIILFVYICDRTDILFKHNQPAFASIAILSCVLLVMVAILVYFNTSVGSLAASLDLHNTKVDLPLCPDLNVEWHGWLVLCILVWQIMGGNLQSQKGVSNIDDDQHFHKGGSLFITFWSQSIVAMVLFIVSSDLTSRVYQDNYHTESTSIFSKPHTRHENNTTGLCVGVLRSLLEVNLLVGCICVIMGQHYLHYRYPALISVTTPGINCLFCHANTPSNHT